jgi:hypothetical protein
VQEEVATSSCACSEHGRSCFQHATHDTMRLNVQRCADIRECACFIGAFYTEWRGVAGGVHPTAIANHRNKTAWRIDDVAHRSVH